MSTTIAPSSGAGDLVTQAGVGTSPGYSAIDLRRMMGIGPVQAGVVAAGDYKVIQRAAGANMSVDISGTASSEAVVQGSTISAQGVYVVPPHNTFPGTNINEVVLTADPSNPRIDQAILQVYDNFVDASGNSIAQTQILKGTATGGATLANRTGAAALPANALRLADILVPAAAASIVTADLMDRRPWARGGHSKIRRTSGNISFTGAATPLDATLLATRMECSGVPVRLWLVGAMASGVGANTDFTFGFRMDSAAVDGTTDGLIWQTNLAASDNMAFNYMYEFTPAAGSHLFQPTGFASIAQGAIYATAAAPLIFTVEEIVLQDANNGTA